MIYPIVTYEQKILRKISNPLDQNTQLGSLIDDMFETLVKANGVGLAAPQIAISSRLFIILYEEKRYVFINPTIYFPMDESNKRVDGSEGCLSVPNVFHNVPRYDKVVVNYYDQNWKEQNTVYEGMMARIIQHEYDHLIGKLYIDYISDNNFFKKMRSISSK